MTRRAEILAIGDELVHGQVVDTNSAWLAQELAAYGLRVDRITVVGDGEAEVADAIGKACARSAVVIATGGLGPTDDDRTRAAAARVVGAELVFDEAAWRSIQAVFRTFGRGLDQPESNRRQAVFPAGATVLQNKWGSAPGFAQAIDGAWFCALPGVPREMRHMFAAHVRPELARGDGISLTFHSLHVIGCGEARLGEMLTEYMVDGADPLVGITASRGQLTVRIASFDAAGVKETTDELRPLLGDLLVYEGDHSLAAEVARHLLERNLTVAVAESCTGGLLGAALTDVPGISAVFRGGFVTYSDAAKVRDLYVDEDLLAAHGAVSEPVAAAMAKGAARRAETRIGVALTGIAGPGGGTDEKPVGTVCFAVTIDGETTVNERRFGDLGREFLRQRAVREALLQLLRSLPRIG